MTGLAGLRAIVTAGPTVEAIDPVRFLSNRSSGKQGYAIAQCLADAGADVVLVSGPTCLEAPDSVTRIDVESARDMLAAVETSLPADVFVGVAAVADWRPETTSRQKSEKSAAGETLKLVENPDILRMVSQRKSERPRLVIGFAAQTHDVLDRARGKRARKGCDWLVANDVSGDVMGGDENSGALLTGASETEWPRASKRALAKRLVERIISEFAIP